MASQFSNLLTYGQSNFVKILETLTQPSPEQYVPWAPYSLISLPIELFLVPASTPLLV